MTTGMNKLNITSTIVSMLFCMLMGCNPVDEAPPAPLEPFPSQNQVEYQQLEFIGFIHFTVNTFTDKEWGYGDESPSVFNPSNLDVRQWARIARQAGMKQLILTAKHHDGFCLWPSKYTEHSVKNSPYKNGKGDIVREFVEACRAEGLKVGLYLSPWDRHQASYGQPTYITYYRNQLEELLTQYGEINELWIDGANGGDGYYGGARETRKIDRKTYYDWPETLKMIYKWQPNITVFSDAGPGVRWIGNEHGHAGDPSWSIIEKDSLVIGGSDREYLNHGSPDGTDWIPGQADVSIRPGWFYHSHEDSLVKTPEHLVDIYYKSVGRNALLLLNFPPDKSGRIHPTDSANVMQMQEILRATFNENLSTDIEVNASSRYKDVALYTPGQVLKDNLSTFWMAAENDANPALTLSSDKAVTWDRLLIQEPIQLGQRISSFVVEIDQNGSWETVFEGKTIGYKRIVRLPHPVSTSKTRIRFTGFRGDPAIAYVGLFLAGPLDKASYSGSVQH